MALRNEEKKEDVLLDSRGEQRDPTDKKKKKKKKKAPTEEDAPADSTPTAVRPKDSKKDKAKGSSLLDQVSAMMDKTANSKRNSIHKKPTPSSKGRRQSIRQPQTNDSGESADSEPALNKKKKAAKKKGSIPPPPPPPAESPAEKAALNAKAKKKKKKRESTLDFLVGLEAANQLRKAHEEEEEEEPEEKKEKKKKKNKKKLKKTMSAARKCDIQQDMAKRRAKRKEQKEAEASHVDDDQIEPVGWFTMTVKENSCAEIDYKHDGDEEEEANKKKKKKKKAKELKSTADYSRDYKFTTRQEMEEKPPGYYQQMVGIKKRNFHIDNLFTRRPHILPRVYHFDVDILQQILDRREDKWFMKSRMPLYEADDNDDDDSQDEDEKGMEALNVFFGPNEIDNDPDDDDNSVIFSIASVESVHFSDDDGNQEMYKGKLRDKVEVMPGEFKMIRKEEETYEAIETGNYMSSLCLGCGVALVSVQDAREVACPTCGSITPLNGVCLHRPFGIATGIKRVKVEHLLKPKVSPFADGGNNIIHKHDKRDNKKNIPRTINTSTGATAASKKPAAPQKEPASLASKLPDMKVSQLRALCKERGIDTTGMLEKQEMVDALQRANQRSRKTAPASANAAKNANASKDTARAAKTGGSGLRIRPSSSNAKAKARPTKPASKPGAVRMATAGRP